MLISRARELLRRRLDPEQTPSDVGDLSAHRLSPERRSDTRGSDVRSGVGHRLGRRARRLTVAGVVSTMTVGGVVVAAPVAHAAENQAPVAVISLTYPSGPLTVGPPLILDASKSYDPEGGPLTYSWEITADTFMNYNEKRVTHRFDLTGTYLIKLTVTDADGKRAIADEWVDVTGENELPLPSFTRSPIGDVTPGQVVTFDGSKSLARGGDPLKYEWHIGPTGVSDYGPVVGTGKVLNYKFPKTGTYSVILVTTDQYGAAAPIGSGVRVVNAAPVASFTRSPSTPTVTAGTTVTYDGGGSSGDLVNYAWTVNGGVTEGGPNRTKFTKTYSAAGTYKVDLTVTDSSGRTSVKSDTVTVTAPAEPPEARFTQTPAGSTVAPGTEVTFDGSASTGDQLKYYWFVRGERGVVGYDPVLNYTFKKPGDYGIQLVVVDSSNRPSVKWTGLEVAAATQPPVARFTQTPSSPSVAAGTTVTFDGTGSTGDQLKYSWKVRGHRGVAGTDPVLNYTFKKPGDYGIQLVVTDSAGRKSKQWTSLTVTGVNQVPIADFTQTPADSVIYDGTTVTFDGTKSSDPDGDQLKYYWYVRGHKGVAGTDPVLKWRFPGPGDYGVQLVVVDPSNASAVKWVGLEVVTS